MVLGFRGLGGATRCRALSDSEGALETGAPQQQPE